jgi:hypothetical protein
MTIISVENLNTRFYGRHLSSIYDLPRQIIVENAEDHIASHTWPSANISVNVGCNNIKNFEGIPDFFDLEMNPINNEFISVNANCNQITSLSGLPKRMPGLILDNNITLKELDSCPIISYFYANDCTNLCNIDAIQCDLTQLSVSCSGIMKLPKIERVENLFMAHCKNIKSDVLESIGRIEVLGLSVDQLAKISMMSLHEMIHSDHRIGTLDMVTIFGKKGGMEYSCCGEDDYTLLNRLKPLQYLRAFNEMSDPFEFQNWCIEQGLEKFL